MIEELTPQDKKGDLMMFVMDAAPIGAEYMPVSVAQVAQHQPPTPSKVRALGSCMAVPNNGNYKETSAVFALGLDDAARAYFRLFEKREVSAKNAVVSILEYPKHGTIKQDEWGHTYLPTAGYFGTDRLVAIVDIRGQRVKVVQYIRVIEGNIGSGTHETQCERKNLNWKISDLAVGASATAIDFNADWNMASNVASWAQSSGPWSCPARFIRAALQCRTAEGADMFGRRERSV